MIYGTVLCPICNKEISKYGMLKHKKSKHGIISEKKNLIKIPKLTKEYLKNKERYKKRAANLSTEIIKEIINLNYQNKTRSEISKILKIDKKIIVEANKIHRLNLKKLNNYKLKQNLSQKMDEFKYSELGQKIIKEYQEFGGTIKGLAKKYGLFPPTLKKIFISVGIPIKDKFKARNEYANTHRGFLSPFYGRRALPGSGKCHWFLYKGVKYQGSWEFKFGLWLLNQNIEFRCHVGIKTFPYSTYQGIDKTYCPDFFIPLWNKYIDVKGYFSKDDQEKIEIVRKTYPEIILEIFDRNRLISEGVMDIDKKLNIEIERYIIDYKTEETYFNKILKTVDKNDLIDDCILNHKTWNKKAKELNVPVIVFSRIMHSLIPKYGSNEYHKFMIQRYLDTDLIKNRLKNGDSKKQISKEIPLFTLKTNYLLVNMIANGAV